MSHCQRSGKQAVRYRICQAVISERGMDICATTFMWHACVINHGVTAVSKTAVWCQAVRQIQGQGTCNMLCTEGHASCKTTPCVDSSCCSAAAVLKMARSSIHEAQAHARSAIAAEVKRCTKWTMRRRRWQWVWGHAQESPPSPRHCHWYCLALWYEIPARIAQRLPHAAPAHAEQLNAAVQI